MQSSGLGFRVIDLGTSRFGSSSFWLSQQVMDLKVYFLGIIISCLLLGVLTVSCEESTVVRVRLNSSRIMVEGSTHLQPPNMYECTSTWKRETPKP